MARFTGKQFPGAQKALKEIRREEADKRNAETLEQNRRRNREGKRSQ